MTNTKNVIPYGRQSIDEADIAAVVEVLKSDFLTQGPRIEQMEQKLCELTGAKHCVLVGSATAGLHIAVAVLGLKKGLEGIATPISFVASSNCMAYNDLIPRFADIDEKTYCLDPKELEKKLGANTRLVIPVDFAGQPADMEKIKAIANKKELYVIEDAAHAIGSIYSSGKSVGSCQYSDMTVFSFHPVKTITTGEGGAVMTNSDDLYDKLLLLRSHGITKDRKKLIQNPGPWYYEMDELGFNYRMTDMQAALGLSQLHKLEAFKKRRRQIVARYNEAFKENPKITIPYEAPGVESCFHLYVVQLDFDSIRKSRKDVMEELLAMGVGTQVHYIPITFQPYYKETFGTKAGDCPIAERYYERALSLPLFPAMTDDEVSKVIVSLNTLFK